MSINSVPDLIPNADLQPLNTFGVPARARYLAEIRSTDDLEKLRQTGIWSDFPRLIIGGGSNLLFMRDYDGLVLRCAIDGIRAEAVDEDTIHVTCGSGVIWHALVEHCMHNDWGGIENLALIPGRTGAAPVQNIGAYGAELKDVFVQAEVIDLVSGEQLVLDRNFCQFGYRDSIFKTQKGKNFFISSVTLSLTRRNHRFHSEYGALQDYLRDNHMDAQSVQSIGHAVMNIRRKKLPDPAVVGNAGSFFKNPVILRTHLQAIQTEHPHVPFYNIDNQYVKVPAGWLIEHAGWRGKQDGHTGVHAQQALVIINTGGATGEEIFLFAQRVSDDVEQRFGVKLEREVQVIG